jgi:hypothetical protein
MSYKLKMNAEMKAGFIIKNESALKKLYWNGIINKNWLKMPRK